MEFKVGDRVEFYFGDDKCEGIIKKVKPHGRYEITDDDYIFYDTSIDNITKITKEKKKTTLEELEQRIEKLEKEVFKPKETKPSLLTEDERVILRNLDKRYIYIARDGLGNLIVFKEHPFRGECAWLTEILQNHAFLQVFNHLFKFIKWEDEIPYNIEELLKGECGNE